MSEKRPTKRKGSHFQGADEEQGRGKWFKHERESAPCSQHYSPYGGHSQGDVDNFSPSSSYHTSKTTAFTAQAAERKKKRDGGSSSASGVRDIRARHDLDRPSSCSADEVHKRETRRSYQSYIETLSLPAQAQHEFMPESYSTGHGLEYDMYSAKSSLKPLKSSTPTYSPWNTAETSTTGDSRKKHGHSKHASAHHSHSKHSDEAASNMGKSKKGAKEVKPLEISHEREAEREELSSPTRKSKRTPVPKKKFSLIDRDDLYVTSSESDPERDVESGSPVVGHKGVKGSKSLIMGHAEDVDEDSGDSQGIGGKRTSSRTPAPKRKFSLLDSDTSMSVSDGKTEVLISEISGPYQGDFMPQEPSKARTSSRTPVPKKEFLLLSGGSGKHGTKEKGDVSSDESDKGKKMEKKVKAGSTTDGKKSKKSKDSPLPVHEQGSRKTKPHDKGPQSPLSRPVYEEHFAVKEGEVKKNKKKKGTASESFTEVGGDKPHGSKSKKSQKNVEGTSPASNSPSVGSDGETKGKKNLDTTPKIAKGKKGLLEMAKLQANVTSPSSSPGSSSTKRKGPVSSATVAVTPKTSGKKSSGKEKMKTQSPAVVEEEHQPIILKLNTSKSESTPGKKEKGDGGSKKGDKGGEGMKKEHKQKGKHKDKKSEKSVPKQDTSEQEHIVLKLSLSPKKKKAPKLKDAPPKEDTGLQDALEPKHISLKIKKISDSDVQVSTSVTDTESGQTQVMESKVEHIDGEGTKAVKKKKKKVHHKEDPKAGLEEKPTKKKKEVAADAKKIEEKVAKKRKLDPGVEPKSEEKPPAKKKKVEPVEGSKKPNVKIVIKKDKNSADGAASKGSAAAKTETPTKEPAAKKPTKTQKVQPKSPVKPKMVTAYLLFCKKYRPKVVADNPGLEFSQVSKKVADMWNNLLEEDKRVWREKAIEVKVQLEKQGIPLHSKSPSSSARKDSPRGGASDGKVDPLLLAAHLRLLGQSLSTVGACLKMQDQIEVHGSLSVLLDSLLCGMAPLLFLTSQVPGIDGCPQETQAKVLDNLAYIMPGLG